VYGVRRKSRVRGGEPLVPLQRCYAGGTAVCGIFSVRTGGVTAW